MENTTLTPATDMTVPPVLGADQALLAAFAARCCEFAKICDNDLTQEESDAYFVRVDAFGAVIHDTPATTIAGVVAKLRVIFQHQVCRAWSDRAIMDPTHPEFVAGLAEADPLEQQMWSAIENLAAIGGVDLAAQAAGAPAEPSPFDVKRLKYLALDAEVKAIDDADGDPRFISAQAEMHRIEQCMADAPSQSRVDAEAKLRFLIDTKRIGVPLDGEETHAVVEDAARFLLAGEVGA